MTSLMTDPVCGMKVEATANPMEYKGVNYAFCSVHCRKKFSDNPDTYVSQTTVDKPNGGSRCN